MKNPKSINFRFVTGWAQLKIIGFRGDSKPYLVLDTGNLDSPEPTRYGYMEDRDIKRLKAWCEDALRKRKNKKERK